MLLLLLLLKYIRMYVYITPMANAGLWGGTPAIHYLEGNGGHIVSSCLSGLSLSIYHLSSPRHWSNITPQPQLQQWEVLSSKGFQPLWQKPPYLQPALTMWANIRGQSPVGLCPGARVPVCPCARGSGLCPGARVPVCPGQRRAGCMLAKCYTDFVQFRSDTLAGSCSLSFDSPNSLSTLRGSYGRCKGRCLIWVLTLVCGILPVNFRMVWLLWHVEVHFDCARSHKVYVCVLGSSVFLLNIILLNIILLNINIFLLNINTIIFLSLDIIIQHHHPPPQLACHDDVLGLICARVPVYFCIDLSFSLALSLSLYLYLPLPLYLSIYPFAYVLCIYMSVCLSFYPPIYLSIYLFVCLSVCLFVCLPACLPACLSVCVSTGCRSAMS